MYFIHGDTHLLVISEKCSTEDLYLRMSTLNLINGKILLMYTVIFDFLSIPSTALTSGS